MWKFPKPVTLDRESPLPPYPLPAEKKLMAQWKRENPKEYRKLEREGRLLEAVRKALDLSEEMELDLRAQNPGMTVMEADQHVRHVRSLTTRDPS